MKRRGFIAGLGSAAVWPLTARAQQPKMPVIGYLGSISPETQARALADFRLGLTETGYVEGRNVAIEFRWGGGQRERFAPLIEDLVRRRVAVIVVNGGGLAVRAAQAATTTIPIVFIIGGDPVHAGFVASLNRPGGNLTGATSFTAELETKQLELLHELIPQRPQ
jgi:putative tryptophan/tyrosine transport system substrate-binding protein